MGLILAKLVENKIKKVVVSSIKQANNSKNLPRLVSSLYLPLQLAPHCSDRLVIWTWGKLSVKKPMKQKHGLVLTLVVYLQQTSFPDQELQEALG